MRPQRHRPVFKHAAPATLAFDPTTILATTILAAANPATASAAIVSEKSVDVAIDRGDNEQAAACHLLPRARRSLALE